MKEEDASEHDIKGLTILLRGLVVYFHIRLHFTPDKDLRSDRGCLWKVRGSTLQTLRYLHMGVSEKFPPELSPINNQRWSRQSRALGQSWYPLEKFCLDQARQTAQYSRSQTRSRENLFHKTHWNLSFRAGATTPDDNADSLAHFNMSVKTVEEVILPRTVPQQDLTTLRLHLPFRPRLEDGVD